jgi:hypothetical protein
MAATTYKGSSATQLLQALRAGWPKMPLSPTQAKPEVLCRPQVEGNLRIPEPSILARLTIHEGDLYSPAKIAQDFYTLSKTGYFEDVRFERVETATCLKVVIHVKEAVKAPAASPAGIQLQVKPPVQPGPTQPPITDAPVVVPSEGMARNAVWRPDSTGS